MISDDGLLEVTAVHGGITWTRLRADQVGNQVQTSRRLSPSLAAQHSFHALTHQRRLGHTLPAGFLFYAAV
jgi:hypothetical protein